MRFRNASPLTAPRPLRFCGEPVGIRTRDLLIKSQLLYRLSYGLAASAEHKRRPSGPVKQLPTECRRSAAAVCRPRAKIVRPARGGSAGSVGIFDSFCSVPGADPGHPHRESIDITEACQSTCNLGLSNLSVGEFYN